MKNFLLLLLLFGFGISTGVYGQEEAKQPSSKTKIPKLEDLLLPKNDTVIMWGAEIKVGAYFYKNWWRAIEIVDSGKSIGKSDSLDFKKGFYFLVLIMIY